jgi:hypothetical protein
MNGNAWTSERDAEARGVPSSASAVVRALTDPDMPIPAVTGEDVKTAMSALVWVRDTDTRERATAYERKLSNRLQGDGEVPLDAVGIVSTAIPVYFDGVRKHSKKDAWAELTNSEYVSEFTPGEYKVVRCKATDPTEITKGNGEIATIVQTQLILRDEKGNGFKWFDSKSRAFKIGQSVKIDRATIAGKSDFNGIRITKINRVKLAV